MHYYSTYPTAIDKAIDLANLCELDVCIRKIAKESSGLCRYSDCDRNIDTKAFAVYLASIMDSDYYWGEIVKPGTPKCKPLCGDCGRVGCGSCKRRGVI